MTRTSLRDWIKDNRERIDAHIRHETGFVPWTASCDCPRSGTNHQHEPEGVRFNDNERRLWVLNAFELYCQARADGVRL